MLDDVDTCTWSRWTLVVTDDLYIIRMGAKI
jgi:hypothetical protein